MFRKIWNDPVWSKVIAAGFVFVIGTYFSWDYLAPAFVWVAKNLRGLIRWLLETTTVPNWLVALLVLCTTWVCIENSRWALRRLGKSGPRGKPFEALSGQQQRYLAAIFRKGSRSFEEYYETSALRWFEELENWKYIQEVYVPVHVGGAPYPYQVTEAGWRELEKKVEK